MPVTEARVKTNVFTPPLPLREYGHLRAVQDLRKREGVEGDREADGLVVFCLRTMAMGDRNATSFGQAAHVHCTLRRAEIAVSPRLVRSRPSRKPTPAVRSWAGACPRAG